MIIAYLYQRYGNKDSTTTGQKRDILRMALQRTISKAYIWKNDALHNRWLQSCIKRTLDPFLA